LRPLAALSHWIDYRGLDLPPWLMHAENIAWYTLLVFSAAALFRRVIAAHGTSRGAHGAGTRTAAMAGFLYAVDLGHALPAGWIANRNALIAGAFGLLAVLAHDRARRDGWRPGAIVGPVCAALALLGSEAGVGAVALVVAHALTLDRSAPRQRALA